ncbi:hypothetical protein KXW98_007416 [Aspergillus fumigatus]|uniref:Oxidoreductase, FAD-binding, putative n=3 Tax=Aspergillus fumigatus TaxID=746128 RepID=Q4WN51_ASPFU|nr:oxidoreductase, FAD-binding, putative [Aspergillus fumigatus Af293]EDP49329.1 oxidoreductase, FAD-binding, putative [Aspergillus fumigatus A1163]KAF4254822.1 hypothetical protein CNMCM8812_007883 [Aspergillus fumigatus]KMK63088.1 oxidoreductase [Aspergillus fumigatus Z5]EAL88613.1 oxidoreductase, FAD-binding, putative [Aspergillus fumigatus Af293]KAF4260756.1 hypothetical protein CNMCM8714_000933 [Aspergillus fumigatus]
MATILAGSLPWHDGERKMQTLLKVPFQSNPTVPYLYPGAAFLVQRSPLMALGTKDEEGRPWATVWGGEPGFAAPASQSTVDIKTLVDSRYDPVAESLLRGSANEDSVSAESAGQLVAGLAIDLEARKRVKLHGRKIAGSLDADSHELGQDCQGQSERGMAHLSLFIQGCLGNCPKYLNMKKIIPALPDPKLISDTPHLPPAAVELLNRADCMFVASTHGAEDMDTNFRGGPPGFVRLMSNGPSGSVLVYPEYSGNRLYQTLGNFQMTPLAGYFFPDFDTGNALYVTGTPEILIGKDAADLLPRSNLAVKLTVTSARFVEKSLAFRGIAGPPSPYTPTVRYLATERVNQVAQFSDDVSVTATMVAKTILTPSIARFRFRISDPSKIGAWAPGQYATFSFQEELDLGYCHMLDDDPLSLNDDYVRTFTISSYPGHGLPADEFEITVRKHGNVTSHLFRTNERAGLEVPLKGFGGGFRLDDQEGDCTIPVIIGGIGITPVIAQLPGISVSRLHLLWTISMADVGLVFDTFQRFPQLPGSTTLFLTGPKPKDEQGSRQLDAVILSGARIEYRRMEARDLDTSLGDTWYFCGGPSLKGSAMTWLAGKRVIYEDFTY